MKSYAAPESATLIAVTEARSAAMAAGSGPERHTAEAELTDYNTRTQLFPNSLVVG